MSTRLLPVLFLWAALFSHAWAEGFAVPQNTADIPLPPDAVPAGNRGKELSDAAEYISGASAAEISEFYKNFFAPYLIEFDGDMPVYEEMEEGAVSGVIYAPVYYEDGRTLKSASFSWGNRFKGGWAVFEVLVSEAASGRIVKISRTVHSAAGKAAAAADESLSALYGAKLKEFAKMEDVKVFLGVPKYPNSVFLPERSAAMTAENGRDTFVFGSMDDALIAADFYSALPGFESVEAGDEVFIFRASGAGGYLSVVVTGTSIEGEPDLITEITVMNTGA